MDVDVHIMIHSRLAKLLEQHGCPDPDRTAWLVVRDYFLQAYGRGEMRIYEACMVLGEYLSAFDGHVVLRYGPPIFAETGEYRAYSIDDENAVASALIELASTMLDRQ